VFCSGLSQVRGRLTGGPPLTAKVFRTADDLSTMEYRRREPRFVIDQPVTVRDLEHPGPPVLGRLVNFSAQGTRLILEQEISPGAMVKVEWGGTMLLGEIIYCAPEGAEFAAGLELEDALYETEVLASMPEFHTEQVPGKR